MNRAWGGAANVGATRQPSTAIDAVDTTTRSQAPLMPCSREGLGSRRVATLKNTDVSRIHRAIPTNHRTRAAPIHGVRIASWLPSTQVPATIVRNRTLRAWLVRSATKADR